MTARRMLQSYVFLRSQKDGWFRTSPLEYDGEYEYGRPFLARLKDGGYVLMQTRTLARRTFRQKIRRFFSHDFRIGHVVLARSASRERLELECSAFGLDFRDATPDGGILAL